jgi:multidrug transporter EmrE-like cation transporter
MFRTPPIAIVCVLVASLLGAVGQFLFKTASHQAKGGPLAVLVNPWALLGMACYVTVMLLFTHAFRKGGTVAVLYPIYATTFIWAAIIAATWYGDAIRPVHMVGMVLLLAGMFLMGW